jgi:eukaryotic-like serine/threonine-protein kinase
MIGKRIAHYQIEARLGAGGMGEVYRAKDTKLGREVAIKILPDALTHDVGRMARFDREAKVLAALNHPHIATLYSVEDRALVMELVEGETLSDRLAKGPLPLEKVLRFALEIADALAAAHAKGIIHRDLKPGNLMITKSGIKVLDFGLAKFDVQLAHTPDSIETLTSVSRQIIGTLPYMAPEQLEGRESDARTDLFALGLVTYEMATGKSLFSGESPAGIIAAVSRCEIPMMNELPAPLPGVIRTCLARDPEDRWQTAREFRIAIRESHEPTRKTIAVTSSPRRNLERFAWAGAVMSLLAVIAGILLLRHPVEVMPIRFLVPPPDDASFQPLAAAPAAGAELAVSPDGRWLAFVATSDGQARVWVRSLDSASGHPLSGTEGATNYPFWSPDSRSIAFFADGKLKRIEVAQGPPRVVADVSTTTWGGAWSSKGTILFCAPGTGIFRVPADGGEITALTQVDKAKEREHVSPRFLPDGDHFFYLATDNDRIDRVYIGSVDTGESKILMKVNSLVEYSPPGYLIYAREGILLAHRFSERNWTLEGDPIPIAESVPFGPLGLVPFSVSATGVLAYQQAGNTSRLVWLDRKGGELGTLGQPAAYNPGPRLSPDGHRLAVSMGPQESDLYVFDVARGGSTRLTSTPTSELAPIWSPDESRIVFSSDRGAPPFLHAKVLDDHGDGEALLPSGTFDIARDWSRDGKFILFSRSDPSNSLDLWTLPMQGERKPQPFQNSRFNESDGRFSPDGNWIVYVSDESGRPEVYLRPFPGPGQAKRVSIAGGTLPRWRRDGQELFYLQGDQLMVVSVKLRPNFEIGIPSMLFRSGTVTIVDYDAGSDGQSFLVNSTVSGPANLPITVVVNWQAGLGR